MQSPLGNPGAAENTRSRLGPLGAQTSQHTRQTEPGTTMSDDQRRLRTRGTARVCVLGSFTLTVDGTSVPLGVDSRRLVAYLAVHPRPQPRASLAADLWPGVPAAAGLRALDDAAEPLDGLGLLAADGPGDVAELPLELAASVEVDLIDAMALIRALPEIPATDKPDT